MEAGKGTLQGNEIKPIGLMVIKLFDTFMVLALFGSDDEKFLVFTSSEVSPD